MKILRIKLNFGPNKEKFNPHTIVDDINRFIHSMLGDKNKWHDAFSPYTVSRLHGEEYDEETNTPNFPKGAYIVVSCDNPDFRDDLLCGLVSGTGEIQTMGYTGMTSYNIKVGPEYDALHIENIRLKRFDKEITFKDEGYLEFLRQHCIKKLIKNGVSESNAESITFEPINEERWKVTYVRMKEGTNRQSTTPSSTIDLLVKGNQNAREKLLCLGFGQSTGSCFGFPFKKSELNFNNNIIKNFCNG